MTNQVKVLVKHLSEDEKVILRQFQPIEVVDVGDLTHRNPAVEKPFAILSADTPLVAWMDADCIVKGDVSELLEATGEALQIRFRSLQENEDLYSLYRVAENKEKPYGAIPESILKSWKENVNDSSKSAISTTVSTCCLIIHRKYFDFVQLWKEQILKVIPQNSGTMLHHDDPYFMADEAVLNSLLAFSHLAPPLKPYLLDQQRDRLLIHFVSRPKPWEMWLKRHLVWLELTLKYLDWAKQEGFVLPRTPWSLRRNCKPFIYSLAYLRDWSSSIKKQLNAI
jgi:lipopolysaccharide biosynthesis glycosyltransferase